MSDSEVIVGLATIIVAGVGGQWIGRRTGVPSLLILLPAGLLAGDVLGLVRPDQLFGDTLNPLVTLLVSLLLFQSGIGLRLADLPRQARGSVTRLVSVGLAVTFAGATGAAALFLDIPASLAFLTGAILVVSGPTVVGPLLEVVRPKEPTGRVLLWEGTVLDPIGATLGVVVLNLVLASDRSGVHPVWQMLGRLGLGVSVGVLAAALLVFVMSRFLLTEDMEAAGALLIAVAAFAVADVLLSEAGLFATVTMGFAVANQRIVSTRRISGFGATLEVLIIGTLFILLGALVEIDDLIAYAGQIALIVAALVLVVRPLTAAISLLGTPLTGRERAMVGWMDPRGIVAAATASQFAGPLDSSGFDADFLLPVTFGVILGTGVVYGLTAKLAATVLGVAEPSPAGVALVGDDPWLLPFGRCLAGAGVTTLLVTTDGVDAGQVAPSRDGTSLTTTSLTEGTGHILDAVREASLARAVVSIDPAAALSLLEPYLIEMLGRRHVVAPPTDHAHGVVAAAPRLWSARAFGGEATRADIDDRFRAGATVQVLTAPVPAGALVLAALRAGGRVDFDVRTSHLRAGDTVIALVDPATAGP